MSHVSHLFNTRRFLPLFLTQGLGAFNDNVYKNALVILITFQSASWLGLDSAMLVVLSGGVFILPFFLFSATAGQLADRHDKARLMRMVKLGEILIMSIALCGFYTREVPFLILILFLMGAQSSLFGPLKYAILPQHLRDDELIAGNGLVAMATFLAILLGTITGGLTVALEPNGPLLVALLVLILAFSGWLTSQFVPAAPRLDSDPAPLDWNIPRQTWRIMQHAAENRGVFIAVLAVSWFWFAGATFFSLVPTLGKEWLGGDAGVVTLLLTMFSVGIGLGSMLCHRLGRSRVEPGLVPLGALGISLFSAELYFAAGDLAAAFPGTLSAAEFLACPGNWRILFDLAMIGVAGGLYIVPLQAMIQQRSRPEHRARIIAANNVFNALFMVISALATLGFLGLGFSVPAIFLGVALLNLLCVGLLCFLQPEFIERFLAWLKPSAE